VPSLHLRFDMLLAALPPAQELDIAQLYLPSPDGGSPYRTYVSIYLGQGELITDKGQSADFALPADGNWHNYRLDLKLAPSLSFDLYVDAPHAAGAPAAQVDEAAPFGASAQVTFGLGISAYGPCGAVKAAFDDVVFQAP
jgi:hypothetical protein